MPFVPHLPALHNELAVEEFGEPTVVTLSNPWVPLISPVDGTPLPHPTTSRLRLPSRPLQPSPPPRTTWSTENHGFRQTSRAEFNRMDSNARSIERARDREEDRRQERAIDWLNEHPRRGTHVPMRTWAQDPDESDEEEEVGVLESIPTPYFTRHTPCMRERRRAARVTRNRFDHSEHIPFTLRVALQNDHLHDEVVRAIVRMCAIGDAEGARIMLEDSRAFLAQLDEQREEAMRTMVEMIAYGSDYTWGS